MCMYVCVCPGISFLFFSIASYVPHYPDITSYTMETRAFSSNYVIGESDRTRGGLLKSLPPEYNFRQSPQVQRLFMQQLGGLHIIRNPERY